jgi:hypothetical protein
MKPTLKAPGSKRLKLKCDNPLSSFAFKFDLRRYNEALEEVMRAVEAGGAEHDRVVARLTADGSAGARAAERAAAAERGAPLAVDGMSPIHLKPSLRHSGVAEDPHVIGPRGGSESCD